MAYLRRIGSSGVWYAQFNVKTPEGKWKTVTRSTGVRVSPKDGKTARQAGNEALQVAMTYEQIANGSMTANRIKSVVADLARRYAGVEVVVPSVKEWFESRVRHHEKSGLSSSGVRNYTDAKKRFLEFLGDEEGALLSTVSGLKIEGFQKWLLERYSYSTAMTLFKLTKRFFADALDHKIIEDSPFALVKTARKSNEDSAVARRAFTSGELEQVLAACDDEWRSMVLVSLYTGGQRLGDIACLQWGAVDFDGGLVSLVTKKTGRPLMIPMVEPLRDLLASRKKSVKGKFVHPIAAEEYERRGSNTLSRMFSRILFRCGLVDSDPLAAGKKREDGAVSRKREKNALSFHSLRSTATTMLHEAGVPAAIVQELVGHSNKEVHQKYIKFGENVVKDALGKLPVFD